MKDRLMKVEGLLVLLINIPPYSLQPYSFPSAMLSHEANNECLRSRLVIALASLRVQSYCFSPFPTIPKNEVFIMPSAMPRITI